jgi:predicted ferric reductase/Ca2+-binding EF-hand superfamily protein
VQRVSRPVAVDAKLLATLERSFARMAGANGVIEVNELRGALGLRSEYLARRVLAAFDLNADGVITKDEFLEGVRKLIAGSDQEKLMFAFRVHDHDGDGSLSRDELYRMVAMSLSESDVTDRPTQSSHTVAHALFAAADTNRNERISFPEFEAVVRKYPAVLRSMTRSEAQWIVPSEDILARIEGGPSALRSTFLENGWGPLTILVLWIATNVALLVLGLMRTHEGVPANELMQAGRALGLCIDFNGALLLLPVMRRLLTWARRTFLGRALPVDHAITFHRIVGHALVALGIAHGGLLIAAYATGHASGSVEHFLVHTQRGLTGSALVLVIAIMWVFALSVIRRSRHFELFYFSHLLYVVWFVLAIVHSPSFLFWAGAPLLGFAVERVLRLGKRGRKTGVTEAQALRSGVTRLELEPPRGFSWSPGDYAFLRIPGIAKHEWHPFTISSAPESGALTFHVRSLGNWTSALRRHVEQRESSEGPEGHAPIEAYVDGPYGSPSAHIFDSRFAVFIGAGIGVTPFASVLASFVLRANGEHPPKLTKAHFFWLNKDQYSFEWFAELLTELWERMLYLIREQHAPMAVDVYFCGPPGLAKKLRPICAQLGLSFREEKF